MKKDILWIVIVILALIIGLALGYILGNNFSCKDNESLNKTPGTNSGANNNPASSAVGSYKTESWNGKPSALVLKSDGTCHYPTGNTGTWSQDDSIVLITLDGNDSVHTAEIVPNGLLLHGHFFEKVT